MIVSVENRAELEISPGNTRASQVYDWAGLISADAWIRIEDGRLVATWSTFLRDEAG